jgi:hypothetical protein
VVLSPHDLRFRKPSALLHSDLFRATIGTPLGPAVRTFVNHDSNARLATCALFWGEILGTDSAIWTLRPEHDKLTTHAMPNIDITLPLLWRLPKG